VTPILGDFIEVTEWGDGAAATLGDLVGTAEAAEILGVERSRIGKWIKRGRMPKPVARLAAGPVWLTEDIRAMIPWVEQHRRQRATTDHSGPTFEITSSRPTRAGTATISGRR
jgi:predicted DNA-binding transcriptional regulator AlpA